MKAHKKQHSNKKEKLNSSIQEDTNSRKKQDQSDEKEQNGIIPEGMDFKKFMGCGG